jgi:thymidylate synthase
MNESTEGMCESSDRAVYDYDSYDLSVAEGGMIIGRGINQLLVNTIEQIFNTAESVPSRLGETKELRSITLVATDPRDRIVLVPGRSTNIVAQIAETLWVFGGSNKLKYLTPFLSRAPQFSDDNGETWRSGYGERLRSYPSAVGGSVDQLKVCEQLLLNDPHSRRAFATISYPPVDHAPGIDVACNVFLSFLCRGNQLSLTTFNRSNDLIWGYSGINFFEFTSILEYISASVNIPMGRYTHMTQSMHVYDYHYDTIDKIFKGSFTDHDIFDESRHIPFVGGSISQFDQLFGQYCHRLDTYFSADNTRTAHDTLVTAAGEFINILKSKPKFTVALYFVIPFLDLLFRDISFDYDTKISLLNNFNHHCDSVAPNSFLKQAVNNRFRKHLDKHQSQIIQIF